MYIENNDLRKEKGSAKLKTKYVHLRKEEKK